VGYHRAGFDVVGVDINPQPNYPFEFLQDDALEVLRQIRKGWSYWSGFVAIHASPPCQAFTQMSGKYRGKGDHFLTNQRLDLLTPALKLLREMDIPWVVENVQGSAPPMRPIITLHGGMFGLGVHRPRLFESNIMLMASRERACEAPVGVYGRAPDGRRLTSYRNNGNWRTAAKPRKSMIRAANSLEQAQQVMGMDWADWHGTKEAIPPAYTEFIGRQLMRHLSSEAVAPAQ
jgi:DNA (cytosine-5)-methyltransferase 1